MVVPGLRGKFVGALLIAAGLPLLVGLVLLETAGFRLLLAERGKLHQSQAATLLRVLDHASQEQAGLLRSWISADPALMDFVVSRNRANDAAVPEAVAAETRRLDQEWAGLAADDPRLLAFLNNPGSKNLRRFQAVHPELAEILVTDATGRLVAATGKATDIDQADEAWWHRGKSLVKGTQWIDELRFDDSSNVFSLDIILPLYDGDRWVGVAKLAVDVTTLFGHLGFDGEALGQRWEIVLSDGRILASSKSDAVSLTENLRPDDLKTVVRTNNGWSVMVDAPGERRMAGFVALCAAGGSPESFVIFSSRRSDVVAPLRRDVLWLGLAGTLLVAGCIGVGYQLIDRRILKPLAALGQAARSISTTARLRHLGAMEEEEIRRSRIQAEADLETIKAIHTGDEVESLAGDLAVMTTRVLRYHRELEAEVEAENPDGVPFGIKRLASSFDQARDGPMAAMPAKIVCDASFFQKRKQYEDDACIVAIEGCGGGGKPRTHGDPRNLPRFSPLRPRRCRATTRNCDRIHPDPPRNHLFRRGARHAGNPRLASAPQRPL